MNRDIVFDFPNGSFLLIGILVLLGAFWSYSRYRQQVLENFADAQLLSQLLVPRSRLFQVLREGAFCIVWLGVTIAVMQPKGNPHYAGGDSREGFSEDVVGEKFLEGEKEGEMIKPRRRAHEVIVLLDSSASMSVGDTPLGQSRLEYGKDIIDDVISLLDGQNVSLYAFTSELSKIVPGTPDYLYTRLLLKDIEINTGDVAGTDLVEVLDAVRKEHFSSRSNSLKTLILLTDGGDTRLERLKGGDREEEVRTILSRLVDAREHNLRVFCIGLGSPGGQEIPGVIFGGKPVVSSLDEDILVQLSEKGRGRYYSANTYSSLNIAEDIIKFISRDEPFVEGKMEKGNLAKVERTLEKDREGELLYDLYFQYPLGIAIFFFITAFLIPQNKAKGIHQR
ncbi:MAG: Ca-activated chloride channel family protein [Chlamydiales bacterium]